MDYLALWADIQANPACGPFIHTNEMPKIGGAEVLVKDQAIADIINETREPRIGPYMITERGVLEALSPAAGDAFLSALEAIQSSSDLPGPLQSSFGAIRRGVAWLKTDGLDLGSPTTRALLDALAGSGVVAVESVATLKAVAEQPDPVTAADVSRAVRGPRE